MGDASGFGSGLDFGGAGAAPAGQPMDITPGADVPPAPSAAQPGPSAPNPGSTFGSGFAQSYHAPDPQMSALDQSADMLQQRIARANKYSANPILQFFDPETAQKARDFAPKAAEELQKIRTQQAGITAGKVQGATLGLAPGEVRDEATQADRVEAAKAGALKGDLRKFQGLQAVSPKDAEVIQDQVHEVVAGHLTKAQFAFDKLSNMRNQGEYAAAVQSLRQDGTLTDLEALGLKVPPSFDAFSSAKAKEGQALREARVGVDAIRNKLEARNTYQPMEEKEAKTYANAWKTVGGDAIDTQPARNASTNARGGVIDGYDDPRKLGPAEVGGKGIALATPEQRTSVRQTAEGTVDKQDLEKFRANNRLFGMATTTSKGVAIPSEGLDNGKGGKTYINDNPNVQQGIAEGLASALRGGMGGATSGLLNIETSKRGAVQSMFDRIVGAYGGAVNSLTGEQIKPYLTQLTQKQQRDVLDYLKTYNKSDIPDRLKDVAYRAGALGLGPDALGLGTKEAAGAVMDDIKRGRDDQVNMDMQRHQAIGGGRGMLSYGALKPVDGSTPPGTPAGTTPATQLPGAPLQTPVQQATQPQQPAPQAPGSPPPAAVPPGAPAPAAAPQGPAGGGTPPGGPAPAPVTIAGQQVAFTPPPGATPNFVPALQRIETGKSKDPWTAEAGRGPGGKPMSSASGAYQMLDATWNENKPAGAPDRAKDATPAQQTEAFAKFTAKNGAALQAAGLPVNDTNLYVAHNLGGAGATRLLAADPNADARTVVGDKAAANNPAFFRGKPTVAIALERYKAEMDKGALPDTGGAKPLPEGDKPGLMTRISRALSQGVPGSGADKDAAVRQVGDAAVEHAPAIGSTLGAVGGTAVGGPAGGVAGGAAGGSAGQSLKDYLQGRDQSPKDIVKEGALGAMFGIMPASRFAGSAVRAAGGGAIEAGAEAAKGGDAVDIAEAGAKGAGLAAGGETFGRALGMVGHKVWSMFAPDAKASIREAAKSYADAEATLAKETPKLPGTGGAAGGPNPAYEAAQAAKEKAEVTLKDAGLKPEEAAYAHKVSSEGVPKREAELAKPGALEQERVGAGYQQLETEIGDKGKGAVKPTPKLADGPRSLVEAGTVSKAHEELASRVEAAITAPAQNWQQKWVQLKDARSDLLQAERDALSSTATGRSQTARDMRTLADSVRTQQEKAAKYVFGEKDGEAFVQRLKVLDTRYRNLMEATNGGDLARAATLKGEAGREADRKFKAFAHDDPAALAAWNAMRQRGVNLEQGVHDLVAAERIPVLGKVFSAAKLLGSFNRWVKERAAGSPARFQDILNAPTDATGATVRDLTGTAAQRGAAM